MLALISSGLSLVLLYVFIANRVFESDKISYVFDSQSSRLNSLKREIEGRIEKTVVLAKSVIANFDLHSGKLNPVGGGLFRDENSIRSIELWNEASGQRLFYLEKNPGSVTALGSISEKVRPGEIKLIAPSEADFRILFRPYRGDDSSLVARVVIDAKGFLPEGDARQALILLRDGKILLSKDTEGVDDALIAKMIADHGQERGERTSMWGEASARYLLSTADLNVGNLRLMAFTPEREALGALKTLLYRSMIFLFFSFFGLVAISLILAKNLTLNLQTLAEAARKIGRGHFDEVPKINSGDEMGVLSGAFVKMSDEIQRLLIETRDKARMESELHTAKLVQESLLPSQPTFRTGEYDINGFVLTSSECGGDWWYHFMRGTDLYIAIADATGHGTPAALITAAARSVFSRLEHEELSLRDMMTAWDYSVSSCSNQRVFMTGILLKLDTTTGEIRYLGAGHEWPYLLSRQGFELKSESVEVDANPTLGEGWAGKPIVEQTLRMEPGSSLVLYTDGLFSVERADGKKLSEKRFSRALATKAEFAGSAEKINAIVLKEFETHREGTPLPDDVTVVTLHRRAPAHEAFLADDSGELLYRQGEKP